MSTADSIGARLGELLSLDDKGIYSLHRMAVYVVVGVALAFFGFPIYWMVISSFKPRESILAYPPEFIPSEITLANYERLFFETAYATWLTNSLIVTGGVIVLSVGLSTLAGYALTRYRIPYKKSFAAIFILAYMFPPITLGVPYFIIFLNLGLIDTLPAVMLGTTAFTLPFCTWLMWQFFQTVPISLEEAAWSNGASRIRGIFEVAIPSAAPGIVAVTIYSFALGWNNFLFAFIFLQSPDQQVLTTGIQNFLQGSQIVWSNLMAAAAVLSLPPILLVLFLNRYIMAGFAVQAN
mgnify:CR=1 FL=1